MNILKTNYAGLELQSPIIAAASPLSSTVNGVSNLDQAGVGAIVLKSLFEEQIINEVAHLESYKDYPETADYLNEYIGGHFLSNYLRLVRLAKEESNVPIIASINCIRGGEWAKFAREIEQAGADAIELNIFVYNSDIDTTSELIEQYYIDTVWSVCAQVDIPVTVKLSKHFTNLTNIINNIEHCGAQGVVLFNRPFQPDINIWDLETTSASMWSNSSELTNSLRWIALSSSLVPRIDIAASGGVHSASDAIKAILAGASAVQLCSTIYQNGLGRIEEINCDIYNWLIEKGLDSLESTIGLLNYENVKNPLDYERVQFMKYFSQDKSYDELPLSVI